MAITSKSSVEKKGLLQNEGSAAANAIRIREQTVRFALLSFLSLWRVRLGIDRCVFP